MSAVRGAFALLVPLGVAVVFSTLGACSGGAPSSVSGAPATPPDDSYETDGGLAYRVLVWTCTPRHERVVIFQRCGEGCAGCGGWGIERTLCPSGPTAFEASIAGKGRHPIPAGYGWR